MEALGQEHCEVKRELCGAMGLRAEAWDRGTALLLPESASESGCSPRGGGSPSPHCPPFSHLENCKS